MKFKICGLPVFIEGVQVTDEEVYVPSMKNFINESFEISEIKEKDLVITIEQVNIVNIPSSQYALKPFCFSTGEIHISVWNDFTDTGIIELQPNWNRAVIYESSDNPDCTKCNLVQIAFTSYLATHRGLFMHGAVVVYKKTAIIFTAPSGGGKSTQADLWVKNFDAEILNGDKALLRMENGKCVVYGSPWAGSSDIWINRGVLLKALIVVKQGQENKMIRLSGVGSLEGVSSQIYYPYWDESLLEMSINTLDEIFKSIPVYELTCRPDKEAADIARTYIFQEPSI